MSRLSTTILFAAGLALVAASLLFTARLLGLMPHQMAQTVAARDELCRVVAPKLSLAAQNNDLFAMRLIALNIVEQSPDLLSMSIQTTDGNIVWQTPRHMYWWGRDVGGQRATTHVQFPILQSRQQWGTLQLRFRPAGPSGIFQFLWSPELRFNIAVVLTVFLIAMCYLRIVRRPTGRLVGST